MAGEWRQGSGLLYPDLAPAAGRRELAGEESAGTPGFARRALQLQAGGAGLARLKGREILRVHRLDALVIAERDRGRIGRTQVHRLGRPGFGGSAQRTGCADQEGKTLQRLAT